MELIIAIAIGSLFIGSVMTLLVQNARMAQRTRDIAVANSYTENKVESLRSSGYLGLSNGTTSLTSELPSELKAPRSATQIIADAPGSVSVKQVDISITYNNQGTPRTYSYTTFIGELGVGQY